MDYGALREATAMNLGAISLVGWLFVVFVTIAVPWAVLRNRGSAIAMARVPLAERFVAMLMPQLILGMTAIGAGYYEGIELFPMRMPTATAWAYGAAFLLAALVLVRPHWRRSVEEHKPTWRLFAPTNKIEGRMWVVLSLSAGIAEELVWRGALPSLLTTLTGSFEVAVTLSVLSFALAHAIQGLRSVLAIATIAASFHALVFISGSLYVAMMVHFIYDVVAGFSYAKFARDLGVLPERGPAEHNSVEG